MDDKRDGLKMMFDAMPRIDVCELMQKNVEQGVMTEVNRRRRRTEALFEALLLFAVAVFVIGVPVWLIATYTDFFAMVVEMVNIGLDVKIDWMQYFGYLKILTNRSTIGMVIFLSVIMCTLVSVDHFMRKLYNRKHIPKI